ncbi:B-box-type zinc finger [Trinorchestia longiramus]|nr:B-box-type zinc finger [Trinorchestia longiramus]
MFAASGTVAKRPGQVWTSLWSLGQGELQSCDSRRVVSWVLKAKLLHGTMANNFPQCEVCISAFDSEKHRPLMLPCGHAFCHSCLDTLQDNGTDSCPSCRAVFEDDVDDLTVCYTLIPKDTSLSTNDKEDICPHHKFPFLYWCKKCKRVSCKQCALETHNGHELLLKEEAVKEEAECVEPREILISKLTTKRTLVTSLMTACDGHLEDQAEMIARIETQKDYLSKKRHQIEKDLDILERKGRRSRSTEEKNWSQLMITSRANEPPDLLDHLVVIKNIVQKKVLKMMQDIDKSGLKCLSSDLNYMKNNEEWVINNEDTAQSALLTIYMTDNKPSSALVRNAPHEAIPFLDILLHYLVQVCDRIDLQLLSSFWQTYYGQVHIDDNLLTPFLENTSRNKLRTFYGRISKEVVIRLCCRKLFCLGLRLDHASDIAAVNAVADAPCYSLHIAVSEQVCLTGLKPIASKLISKCCIFLHFVELNDGDLLWMMQIIDALLPTQAEAQETQHNSTNRIAGLYLVNCNLTTMEAVKLLTWVHDTHLTDCVWYQTSSHDDFSKKLLEERAAAVKLQLLWDAVLPRARRMSR